MAQKSKQIVWHKKTGKFISPKFLKPRQKTEKEKSLEQKTVERSDRIKDFSKKFLQEIRKAL